MFEKLQDRRSDERSAQKLKSKTCESKLRSGSPEVLGCAKCGCSKVFKKRKILGKNVDVMEQDREMHASLRFKRRRSQEEASCSTPRHLDVALSSAFPGRRKTVEEHILD